MYPFISSLCTLGDLLKELQGGGGGWNRAVSLDSLNTN